MDKARGFRIALLLSCHCFSLASLVSGQEYEVIDLGPIGYRHQTWSINQNGQVVGYSEELPAGEVEGFVYDGKDFILIGHPPQTSRSDLLGINNLGEAVGKSGTLQENGQAILWTPGGAHGHIQSLGTLGGSRSGGRSINDLRQVVGWSKLPGDAESRPFIWEDGVMDSLPLLGGGQGQARWINNAGQIVGGSTTDTDGLTQFAVIWEDGTVTRLPPFYPERPGLNHIANYIHDNGDIAGTIRIPETFPDFTSRAVIWRDGQVHLQLGTLADNTPVEPEASSWASGVNASGVVVGMSVNDQRSLVPFVYRNGEMVQLDDLTPGEWVMTFIGSGAINDAGQIAVSAFIPGDPSGNLHALLLTPTQPTAVADGAGSARTETSYLATQGHRIKFGISRSNPVTVSLFDVTGRLIAMPVDEVRPAGDHEVFWNGRTRSGHPAASGVYFVRMSTPDFVASSRLVLVR